MNVPHNSIPDNRRECVFVFWQKRTLFLGVLYDCQELCGSNRSCAFFGGTASAVPLFSKFVEMKNNRLKKIIFQFSNIIVALALGLTVYVLWRKDTLISKHLIEAFGFDPVVNIELPKWLMYVLCNYASDFLWAYALAFSVICILWQSEKSKTAFLICTVFIVICEVCQQAEWFQGTFDVLDIFVEITAVFLALWFNIKNEERVK